MLWTMIFFSLSLSHCYTHPYPSGGDPFCSTFPPSLRLSVSLSLRPFVSSSLRLLSAFLKYIAELYNIIAFWHAAAYVCKSIGKSLGIHQAGSCHHPLLQGKHGKTCRVQHFLCERTRCGVTARHVAKVLEQLAGGSWQSVKAWRC